VRLGPVCVHPIEHLGPVLRLGSARAGLEGDNRIVAVVLAGQERLEAGVFHLLLQLMIAVPELLQHGVVIFLKRHLADGHQVVPVLAHFMVALDLGLDLACVLHDLLRLLLIVPEAGGLDLRVQPVELLEAAVYIERCGQLVQLRAKSVQFGLIFFKFYHIYHASQNYLRYYIRKRLCCKGVPGRI